jgi:hypothetical protein
MDPVTLAATATAILAPYLAKAGQALLEDAAKQIPDAVGNLWDHLAERFRSKPAAEDAAKDLLSQPGDPDNQEAFKTQLRKMLKDDPEFARELESLVAKAQAAINIQVQGGGAAATTGGVAAGQGGIAVKGNVEGNIILGDKNTVKGNPKKL